MAKAKELVGPGGHKKEIIGLLKENARRHRLHTVFSDWMALCALAMSNAVDRQQYEAREARYLEIVSRYERDEVERFTRMYALLVLWMEGGFADYLGDLFMSLELGDAFKGQFFTPYPVSLCMAQMTLVDAAAVIQRQGFITVCEPAAGSGGMVIACAEALCNAKQNYQQAMHATTVDVDETAVHMAYVQLGLLHVPAIVIHGNSLSLTEWAHWVTPAHVLGGWDFRLRRLASARARENIPAEAPSSTVQPMPAIAVVEEPPSIADQASDARAGILAQRLEQMNLFA